MATNNRQCRVYLQYDTAGVSFFYTKIRITQQNLNTNRKYLTQAGLNDEKTGVRESRWTVPLKAGFLKVVYSCNPK